jgi:hypothetical protein
MADDVAVGTEDSQEVQPEATNEDESQRIEVPEAGEQKETAEKPERQAPEATAPQGDPKWFKPDLFKLKYRGSQVTPKDYNHAVQLMQQGWSYSQAMEQVKREKADLEARGQAYSQYEKLDQAFKQNPAFAQKIWQMYQEAQGGAQAQPAQQPQQQSADPRVQQLYQTVSQMQQKLQTWDNYQADQEVQREMGDLKSKMPDIQWDQTTESGHSLMYDVLSHAHQHRFPSLMAAARDYLWDSHAANARMSGAQQVADAKRKASKQGVVSAGGNGPAQSSGKTVNVKDVSYDDLTSMALKSLGINK